MEESLHSGANQGDQSAVEVWCNAPKFVNTAAPGKESNQQQRQGKFRLASEQGDEQELPVILERGDDIGQKGKHYLKNKMRKGRDRSLKNKAVESKIASTSTPATRNIESQSSVDQLVSHWQELNKFVPQNLDEVFNLCLSSETCLYTATKTFKPLQLAVFKRKIGELGGEVETCEIHFHRARGFAENVSDDLLESELDPASRERALENLALLTRVQEICGTVLDIAATGLEPRASIFQARKVAGLIEHRRRMKYFLVQSSDWRLAHLQSEDHQPKGSRRSSGLSDLASTPSPSISDPESDDYDPEELRLIDHQQQNQVEPSSFESRVRDLAKQLLPVEARVVETETIQARCVEIEAAEAYDQLAGICSIDNGGSLVQFVQDTSLREKLAREELAYQQLGNQDADDPTIVDITDHDSTVEGSLFADDSIVRNITYENIHERPTDFDDLIGEGTEIKSEFGQVLPGRNNNTVKVPVCLNPATLNPATQKILNDSTANKNPIDTALKSKVQQLDKPARGMAIAVEVSLPLPPLPTGWSGNNGKDFKAVGEISPATLRNVEPVGPYYLAHARRARHKRTFSEDDRIQAQESVKAVEDSDDGEISEAEDPAMLLRDAKDWKGQDHYAVLGLSKHRWRATEEQIKRAHRKKVLRHHPDKKAAAGSTEDDTFFKCIQKATEILLDTVKRRQFDSVDEAADVEPPTKKQTQKGNFYKLWGPVFEEEGRFSKIQPTPALGDENSSKEDVENFYNFWYNFDSWRSFEYQDEDVPDDNENRDQKRHMERKNNSARKKKKTEDSARLRKLLDDCSTLDERIKKFRQEANASKNKKRLEKEAAEKKAVEDAKLKKEADEKVAREAEEATKADREQGKKAKEAAKNAVKKNKRVLKASVKDANYFVTGNPPAATIDNVLNDVELVQGKVDADEIAALANKLTGLKVSGEIKAVWKEEVKRLVGAGKLKDGDIRTFV